MSLRRWAATKKASRRNLNGGVVIMSSLRSRIVILFGAVINAQSEKQTRKDSTVGRPEAMGRRGARAADELGETR